MSLQILFRGEDVSENFISKNRTDNPVVLDEYNQSPANVIIFDRDVHGLPRLHYLRINRKVIVPFEKPAPPKGEEHKYDVVSFTGKVAKLPLTDHFDVDTFLSDVNITGETYFLSG